MTQTMIEEQRLSPNFVPARKAREVSEAMLRARLMIERLAGRASYVRQALERLPDPRVRDGYLRRYHVLDDEIAALREQAGIRQQEAQVVLAHAWPRGGAGPRGAGAGLAALWPLAVAGSAGAVVAWWLAHDSTEDRVTAALGELLHQAAHETCADGEIVNMWREGQKRLLFAPKRHWLTAGRSAGGLVKFGVVAAAVKVLLLERAFGWRSAWGWPVALTAGFLAGLPRSER